MSSPEAPPAPLALLLTDLVDSTGVAARLGQAELGTMSAQHDALARELVREWCGREIDKSDGFLLVFEQAADALGFALAYHRALAALGLRARAGLHVGDVVLRENPPHHVAQGAKPLEVDGLAKPIAARVMSTGLAGQTLLTGAALQALRAAAAPAHRVVSHGHWRFQGLSEPLELFEAGDETAPFAAPPDTAKAVRMVKKDANRDGDSDLWVPAREVPHSLPAERNAFVGRRHTLLELDRRLTEGARLVSLLGMGGTGKTRLAVRFGWTHLADFPGGVWFCDLATARGPEGLVGAVAQGLGVPLGREDAISQIGHAVAGRGHCLVVLDNFEQLTRHAEATLGRWLERAPQARFLVTTREVLGINGEEAMMVAPLRLDDARDLFLRRAAAARRDFQPQADDLAAVDTLVQMLDGLPLAIELAAARVRTLAPRALLARMSERFKLLAHSSPSGTAATAGTAGSANAEPEARHATLRATFDWSWDLLNSADKQALAQLSVFEGGFTLEAAESVILLRELEDEPWVLDLVQSLVDKSFVRSLDNERFDLLSSVQAYAAEHLATAGRFAGSGEAARTAAELRHALWFSKLGLEGARTNGAAEIDNLVAATQRGTAAAEAPLAVGALEGAWGALSLRGPLQSGLELAKAVSAPCLRCRRRWLRGR